jgi:RimJ/RimL family protein N-acetyltransferase
VTTTQLLLEGEKEMTLDNIFKSFPELETQRLSLRRIKVADSEAFFRILADDEVTKYYDDSTFTELSQAREQIEAWENGFRNRRCIRWGIARKGDPAILGTCGYYGFHTWHKRAGIGYELGRVNWRQGLMSEALSAIIDLGFQEMELNRIEAVVMPENLASIRLLEKLGFQKEGELREYENWGEKGFANLLMFSLLQRETTRGQKC